MQLFEARTGQAVITARLDLPPGAIRDLAFAPDGRSLVVATATGASYLHRLAHRALAIKLGGHRDEVTMGSFSADGARVATASADGTVRMFAAATGAALAVCKAHPLARVVRFSPGMLVVTAGNESTVRLWHARNLTRVAELHGHRSEVLSARFCSRRHPACCRERGRHRAFIWDSRTGRLQASLVGHIPAR